MASTGLSIVDLQHEQTILMAPSSEADTHSVQEEVLTASEARAVDDGFFYLSADEEETLLIVPEDKDSFLPFEEEETLLIDIKLEDEDSENGCTGTGAAAQEPVVPDTQVDEARDVDKVDDDDLPGDFFPMGRLPAELQGKILGYLTKSEKIAVRKVCRTWAELIGPNCGRMTDNPGVLELLNHAIFTKMNTLIVEDFSQTELPRNSNGDVVPATLKKLQFDGFLNLPESVKILVEHYGDFVEKLELNQYCLGRIDAQLVRTWEFSNLSEISFTMEVPMDEMYRVKNKGIALCTHVHNWISILDKKLPKLNSVDGHLVISRQNEKLKFKPKFEPTFANMMPNFLTKLEVFASRHIGQLTNFTLHEELYAHQFIQRWRQGMFYYFDCEHLDLSFGNCTEFAKYHRAHQVSVVHLMREEPDSYKLQLICNYLTFLEKTDFYYDYIYIVIDYVWREARRPGNSGKFPVDMRVTIYHSDIIA